MPPVNTPYWWDAVNRETKDKPEFKSEYDAVVVGAGLTGSSAARTLAKNGSSVLLLDAEAPGHGASTRNGGMVGEGHRVPLEVMAARYGMETAKSLLREIYIEPLGFVKNLVQEENLDCDFKTHGRFRGMWNAAEYDTTARSLDDLRKIAPLNVEMIPPEKMKSEVNTDMYAGGLLLHDHGGLHPGKYLTSMVDAARRAGATVCGNTPVSSVKASGSGYEVMTDQGSVRAGSVLMATNGYTKKSFSWLKRRIFPVTVYVIATEELPPELINEIMPGGRMVVETRHRHCYYRQSPDGKRIILGARAALSEIPYASAQKILHGLLAEIFPKLGNVGITHCWRGNTGFTFSFLPHLGQQDGVWHAMGFSGSGNGMAPYLGNKAALNMLGVQGKETSFTKTTFETKFWYHGWPWFLPFAHALYRAVDFRENMKHLR